MESAFFDLQSVTFLYRPDFLADRDLQWIPRNSVLEPEVLKHLLAQSVIGL